MPHKHFLAISQFLCFVDNETVEERIQKVRSIVHYLNNKFEQLYTLDGGASLGESLMKVKGWLGYVQFIATKQARFGIKFTSNMKTILDIAPTKC